jgi:nucleoside-diphosphate-sugar epimerase
MITPPLVQRLGAAGYQGHYLGRDPYPERFAKRQSPFFSWARFNAAEPGDWMVPEGATVIATIPMTILRPLLPRLSGAGDIIAFSSTSAISYADSADPEERRFAATLLAAEQEVLAVAARCGARCTILRPTMIYGDGRDRTISSIVRFVDRFGLFPIAAPGRGLRQPVHADDLAAAAVAALQSDSARGQIFELSGADVLTFRDLVTSILLQTGRPVRILPLPARLLRWSFRLGGAFLPSGYLAGMFERMNIDQAFSHEAATRAFGYAPRGFRLSGEDIPR